MFPLLMRLRRPAREAAAPATALAVLLALLVLEQRGFNRDSALLFALLSAVAAARIFPAGALAFAAGTLLLQAIKVLPVVMVSGVLSYLAVPLVILFATLGFRGRHRSLLPVFAVASAGLITVNWFADGTWVNFVFGAQLYGRGALRTGTYVFLVFGAFAAFNLAAWAAGLAVNNAGSSRRAQLRAEAGLRQAATELAVEQERNRIARELHDVLAHSLTVITAQAEGIRYIHRSEPEAVEESALIIASAARSALVETRRMLENVAPADTSPAPTLDQLESLATQFAASGMQVTVDAPGSGTDVTPLQGLTAYRLVQESLTNAFRHGDRTKGATVSVRPGPDGLMVRVSSELATAGTASSPGTGRGIPGMKERTTAVGGSFTTRTTGQHFEMEALLP
ncbi:MULTISPECIES: sensor histidine kinase [unclassified Pseudarthrobacter]|uniref:sensor histidine kinase n=1 Tax=unclassified Pseudarthrobacter TaxID=2647000 RepID=UPI0030785E2B